MAKRVVKQKFQQSGLKMPPVEGRHHQPFALSLCLSWWLPVDLSLCSCPCPIPALLLPCLGCVNEHWFDFFSLHGFLDWFLVGSGQCPSSWPISPRQPQQDLQSIPAGWAVGTGGETPQESSGLSGILTGQGLLQSSSAVNGDWGSSSPWDTLEWAFPEVLGQLLLWDGTGVFLVGLHQEWCLSCSSRDASTGEPPQNQMLTCEESSNSRRN